MPVCDLHLDTVLEIQGGADLKGGNPAGHVDLARMREGGAGLLIFACFVPAVLPHGRVFREAMDLLDVIDRTCQRLPDDLMKELPAIMKSDMEKAVELRIPVIVDLKSGKNWADML